MVFDNEGNLLASWGEGLFKRAHGICISPEGSIYCTDDELHVVYKFTTEGALLETLGNKCQPSNTGYEPERVDFLWSLTTIKRGGPPFNRPTGVVLSFSGEIYVLDGSPVPCAYHCRGSFKYPLVAFAVIPDDYSGACYRRPI